MAQIYCLSNTGISTRTRNPPLQPSYNSHPPLSLHSKPKTLISTTNKTALPKPVEKTQLVSTLSPITPNLISKQHHSSEYQYISRFSTKFLDLAKRIATWNFRFGAGARIGVGSVELGSSFCPVGGNLWSFYVWEDCLRFLARIVGVWSIDGMICDERCYTYV